MNDKNQLLFLECNLSLEYNLFKTNFKYKYKTKIIIKLISKINMY